MGRNKPAKIFIRVVFPAPEGPASATHSPGAISRSRSLMIRGSLSLYRKLMPRAVSVGRLEIFRAGAKFARAFVSSGSVNAISANLSPCILKVPSLTAVSRHLPTRCENWSL